MRLTPFGLCVRKLRLEQGMTLKVMADALHVSSAYLSSVELGDKQLTPKLGEDAISFLLARVSAQQIEELRDAIARSMDIVPIDALEGEERVLVAAFARRLTEGEGIPDDVIRWLNKGGGHGRNKQ